MINLQDEIAACLASEILMIFVTLAFNSVGKFNAKAVIKYIVIFTAINIVMNIALYFISLIPY